MLKSKIISIIKSHALTIAAPNEPFKLSNGGTSNYFINCKNITLNPNYLSVIIDHITDFIIRENLHKNLNHIAGVAIGGCPLATALSYKIFKDDEFYPHPTTLYIRSNQKDHGTKQLIEGKYSVGERVLVLEDVITTGKSTLNAISILENAGLEVIGVISILDRNEGGTQNLARYKYFPLVFIDEIIKLPVKYFNTGYGIGIELVPNYKENGVGFGKGSNQKLIQVIDECGYWIKEENVEEIK